MSQNPAKRLMRFIYFLHLAIAVEQEVTEETEEVPAHSSAKMQSPMAGKGMIGRGIRAGFFIPLPIIPLPS